MSLRKTNPYLRDLSDAEVRAALLVSAKTSSAIEGIRKPFSKENIAKAPTTKEEFIAFWRQRSKR